MPFTEELPTQSASPHRAPMIARRGEEHGSGLGVYRWVVEQGFALLHWLTWSFTGPGSPWA